MHKSEFDQVIADALARSAEAAPRADEDAPGKRIRTAPAPRVTQKKRDIVAMLSSGSGATQAAIAERVGATQAYVSMVRRECAGLIEIERLRRAGRKLDGTPNPHKEDEGMTNPMMPATVAPTAPDAPLPPLKTSEPASRALPRVSMVTLTGAAHTYVVTPGKVDIDGALSIPAGDVEAIAHELEAVLAQANAMGMA